MKKYEVRIIKKEKLFDSELYVFEDDEPVIATTLLNIWGKLPEDNIEVQRTFTEDYKKQIKEYMNTQTLKNMKYLFGHDDELLEKYKNNLMVPVFKNQLSRLEMIE